MDEELTFKAGTPLRFSATGEIQAGTLEGEMKYRSGGRDFVFASETEIAFGPSGSVLTARLAHASHVGPESAGANFPAKTLLRFGQSGWTYALRAELPTPITLEKGGRAWLVTETELGDEYDMTLRATLAQPVDVDVGRNHLKLGGHIRLAADGSVTEAELGADAACVVGSERFELRRGTTVAFHPDGTVARGVLAASAEVKIADTTVRVPRDGTLTFHPDGHLESLPLPGETAVKVGPRLVRFASSTTGTALGLHPNGSVSFGTLATALKFKVGAQELVAPAGSAISFFRSGAIQRASSSADVELPVGTRTEYSAAGGDVCFTESGAVACVSNSAATETVAGRKIELRHPCFSPAGSVVSGALVRPTEFRVGGQSPKFVEGISWHDNGQLRWGTLARESLLSVPVTIHGARGNVQVRSVFARPDSVVLVGEVGAPAFIGTTGLRPGDWIYLPPKELGEDHALLIKRGLAGSGVIEEDLSLPLAGRAVRLAKGSYFDFSPDSFLADPDSRVAVTLSQDLVLDGRTLARRGDQVSRRSLEELARGAR